MSTNGKQEVDILKQACRGSASDGSEEGEKDSPPPKKRKTAGVEKPKPKPKAKKQAEKSKKAKGARETEFCPLNDYPFLIHDGLDSYLAASPKAPGSLSPIFSCIREMGIVEEALEEWAPLVLNLCEDEGVECGSPPCVTLVKLRRDSFMRFRMKQLELKLPYNVWYSPLGDTKTEKLPLRLKHEVRLHTHQEEALDKVVRHGYAGSGMVVLPCGSGKTLTGLTLATRISRSTLILCNSLTSVAQWQASMRQFCDIGPDLKMGIFSVKHKIDPEANIVFTTYSILGTDRGAAQKSNMGRLLIEVKKWGLVLLDEVHVVPTATFTKALGRFHARCIVGLTATPLREDGKLLNLPYLISPVTFYEEANWKRLTDEGFLARVACVEVRCALDETFGKKLEEMKDPPKGDASVKRAAAQKRELLGTANPDKLRCCQALMHFHEQQGDKVLIFCDSIFVLQYLHDVLKRPMIMGNTKDDRKIATLNEFKGSCNGTTILFSRVGDTSIDLPEANVIVEVGAHFGSRCQETQRFGRVSRPKARNPQAAEGDPDAYFYSLLSEGTEEPRFGAKRQEFLVEKGYDFVSIHGRDILRHHRKSFPSAPLILSNQNDVATLLQSALDFKGGTRK